MERLDLCVRSQATGKFVIEGMIIGDTMQEKYLYTPNRKLCNVWTYIGMDTEEKWII